MAFSNLIFFSKNIVVVSVLIKLSVWHGRPLILYGLFLCWILLFRRNLIMEILMQLGMYSKHLEILNLTPSVKFCGPL